MKNAFSTKKKKKSFHNVKERNQTQITTQSSEQEIQNDHPKRKFSQEKELESNEKEETHPMGGVAASPLFSLSCWSTGRATELEISRGESRQEPWSFSSASWRPCTTLSARNASTKAETKRRSAIATTMTDFTANAPVSLRQHKCSSTK